LDRPFKKADRLSSLIQRFHIRARVQSIGRGLLTSEAEGQSPGVTSGEGTGEQDTGPADVSGLMDVSGPIDGSGNDTVLQLRPREDTGGEDIGVEDTEVIDAGLSVGEANFFVVQRGQISSSAPEFEGLKSDVPLLVFYPRGAPGDFGLINRETSGYSRSGDNRGSGAEQGGNGFVCAVVDTGGEANPIALALPDLVLVRLDQSAPLRAVTDILLEEAMAPRCGGRAVIDRLCEIVVIRLLRHLIESGETEVGLLAGLADPNISLAIIAMHDNPDRNYNLEDLAEISAMSRTHFANSFRKLVGVTPGQYLSNWRLTLARTELAKGVPLKAIAGRIGFSSSAALSRAFTRRYGVSPKQEMLRG